MKTFLKTLGVLSSLSCTVPSFHMCVFWVLVLHQGSFMGSKVSPAQGIPLLLLALGGLVLPVVLAVSLFLGKSRLKFLVILTLTLLIHTGLILNVREFMNFLPVYLGALFFLLPGCFVRIGEFKYKTQSQPSEDPGL